MLYKGRKTEDDLIVSYDTLDDAIDHQAGLVDWYGEEWANADKVMRMLEIEVDQIKAIREEYYRTKGAKSETQVKSLVMKDKEYIGAKKEYVEARWLVNKLEVHCKALEHKKKSIGWKMERWIASNYPEANQRRTIAEMKSLQADAIHAKIQKEVQEKKHIKVKRRK